MKPIATLLSMIFVLVLSGCNTVQGVGQDVQKAGQVLEDAAKRK
jgi:predicted small secreted protein